MEEGRGGNGVGGGEGREWSRGRGGNGVGGGEGGMEEGESICL